MANIKYFNGTEELKSIHGMKNAEFAAKFPGVKGRKYDGYSMWVGYPLTGFGGVLPVERMITYKAFPSKHECNAKCMGGKVNGTCECRCGGKNHGVGSVPPIGRPMAEVLKEAA